MAAKPPAGTLRLEHFAEVAGIYHLHEVVSVLALSPMHLWSDETARARFHYKMPGLYVLAVRVGGEMAAGPLLGDSRLVGGELELQLERRPEPTAIE